MAACLISRRTCLQRSGAHFRRLAAYAPSQHRRSSTLPDLPVFQAISRHDPASIAVVHSGTEEVFPYGRILGDVASAADKLRSAAGQREISGERVAFLTGNSYNYVVTWLAILAAKAIAVPLAQAFPISELRYVAEHSQASLVVSSGEFAGKVDEVIRSDAVGHLILDHNAGAQIQVTTDQARFSAETSPSPVLSHQSDQDAAGMMLYTSGTTSRPKGVLIPEATMTAQANSLIEAWKYSPSDHFLHVLPLHHIHGTINAVYAPLLAGSTIEFLYPFHANQVWTRFAAPFQASRSSSRHTDRAITCFTAVPRVYDRLLAALPRLDEEAQADAKAAISATNLRLCMSGSAPLPTSLKSAWTAASNGNVLLERYGMTEIGMALSCGLEFEDRIDGSVGTPLPGVEVRLVDLQTDEEIKLGEESDDNGQTRLGEIQVRGPTVFKEYWQNLEATKKEFVSTGDGQKWFKTGDVAVRRPHPTKPRADDGEANMVYHILGRLSADIIKVGGEKVSALEVERELLDLPNIADAAVCSVPSENLTEKVGAVIVLRSGSSDTAEANDPTDKSQGVLTRRMVREMRAALETRLARHQMPTKLRIVDEIPRNAMGKVDKKQLSRQLFGSNV